MGKYSTGGAIAGGAAGAYFGGPAGAVAGAGVGGAIGGQFDKKTKYKSPSFADIDLARDNPQLYAQLMKQEEILAQYEALYNQRSTGPSLSEQRMRDQSLDAMRGQAASRGMLGGSTSFLNEMDFGERYNDQIAQRIFQEQQALLGARAAQQGNLVGLYGNAQNNIMNNMNQQSMTDYNQKMAEDMARNQFYASLMQGGAQMYGADKQSTAMDRNSDELRAMRMAQYYPQPAPQPVVVQQAPVNYGYSGVPQQPQYNYQFGQSSPYYRGY